MFGCVQSDEGISERGAGRIDIPNQALGCLRAIKHSGRIRRENQAGFYPFSLYTYGSVHELETQIFLPAIWATFTKDAGVGEKSAKVERMLKGLVEVSGKPGTLEPSDP